MGKVISIINEKGGVGKTTTAQALLNGLTLRGYKTLGIDTDAQGDLTSVIGGSKKGATALGFILGECKAEEAIQHTGSGDLIASSSTLKGADLLIPNKADADAEESGDIPHPESILRNALSEIKDQYDFIIIDTPRASGALTTNTLTASDYVIAPTNADKLALEGIERLAKTIEINRKRANPDLTLIGILLTDFPAGNSILARDMAKNTEIVAKKIGTKVYSTRIRRGVKIQEAQAYRENIFTYDRKANPMKDYDAFIDELLGDLKDE